MGCWGGDGGKGGEGGGGGFGADVVPEVGLDKGGQQSGAALDEQGCYAVAVQLLHCTPEGIGGAGIGDEYGRPLDERSADYDVLPAKDDGTRRGSGPEPGVESRMVGPYCAGPDGDSVELCAQLVHERLSHRGGEGVRAGMVGGADSVDVAVGTLCPF